AVLGTDYQNYAFPFTTQTYGVSTSTTVGFTNGLLSTASSTFTSDVRLSSLGTGTLNVGAGGLLYSGATTTFSGGLTYSNGNVTLDWMFPNNATTTILTFTNGNITATSTVTGNFVVMGNSTTTNATTTNFAISNIAAGSLLKTATGGAIIPAVQNVDYSAFAYLFPSNATTTRLAFDSGFTATNSTTTNASTTNLSATTAAFGGTGTTTIASTGALFTPALTVSTLTGPLQAISGLVSASSTISVAYGGTGLSTPPTYGQLLLGNASGGYTLTATSSLGLPTFAYLFPNNATTTTLTFSNGLLSLASTTIGAGGQTTGLTVFGGATTTGNAYFAGNVGIGTPSPTVPLHVSGSYRLYDVAGAVLTSGVYSGVSLAADNAQSGKIGFQVAGAGGQTAEIFRVTDSTFVSPFFSVGASGRVGIGTSTPYSNLSVWGSGALFEAVNNASSTIFRIGQDGATTTNFAISGITSSLLKTNTSGSVVAAVAGTDYQTFAYPFTAAGNATTTLTQFNGGIT
ncbi:MAG: hypothetical protein HYS74_02955, partial [Parcubacteria group bacterium]|nr:hypothetical protein [Parcubacteria group bacterium]